MATLKYPSQIKDSGLYLQFVMYDYAKAQMSEVKDLRDYLTEGVSGKIVSSTAEFFSNLPGTIGGLFTGASSNPDSPQAQEARREQQTSNTSIGNIFLYLPPKLEYSYGAEWNKVSFGALGAAVGGGGIDVKGLLGAATSTFGNTFLNQALGNNMENVPKVEGVDLNSILGASFGVTFNDNTIQNFDRMSTRTFTFDYLLVARNSTEELEIRKIIKTFKAAMHPESQVSGQNNTLLLKYPYVFRILPSGYLQKATSETGKRLSKFLPATKFCGLTRFAVDYTPDNVVALTPGEFVQAVRISLVFSELTPLTREDIMKWEDSAEIDLK
jgi:hypothetical protein